MSGCTDAGKHAGPIQCLSDYDYGPRRRPERRASAHVHAMGSRSVLVIKVAQGFEAGDVNARAETVAEKPFFREAFKRNRCLIPVSGYYEKRAGLIFEPLTCLKNGDLLSGE